MIPTSESLDLVVTPIERGADRDVFDGGGRISPARTTARKRQSKTETEARRVLLRAVNKDTEK
jgi:hypothetical protein